ncbi:MAG TPA: glycerophosphodiester phosphodiesterase [Terriglobales bacterium]|nr:glycerophosphodiester phosphodiesterase [Terriglobales bacterium]
MRRLTSQQKPLLLGHRGHRLIEFDELENSMPAFDRALGSGCDGLELDLRVGPKGQVVICHDSCDRYETKKLARLGPVLRRYRKRAFLDLEIKEMGVVEELVRLLQLHPPERGFVVSSFDPAILRRVRTLAPSTPLCLNLRRPRTLRQLAGADVEWIAPQQASCTAWYVRRLRRAGWRVLVWTVNHPVKMRRLARAGADALVSDNPELLVKTLAGLCASGDTDDHRHRAHSTASGRVRRMVSQLRPRRR